MGERQPAGRATRIDKEAGIREEIGFIGSGPEKLFSKINAPLGEARGAVLLCSSILAELLSGYQEEVWLARRLAERGLVVRRFHYRGAGHSDGDAEDLTYERACEDAAQVADLLREETGEERIGFIGTRMGALIAASAAARFPDAPIAFIQPLLKGEQLFKEIARSRLIWHMNEEGRAEGQPPPEDMVAVMEREGWVDVLGYRLTQRLYRDLGGLRLEDELGPLPRSVQLVQVARRKSLAPEYQRFLAALDTKGFTTESAVVDDEIAWWFHDSRRHLIPEIGDAIVPWLADRIVKEEAR